MLKTKEKIESWLQQYNIDNYTINKDLTIDVENSIDLSYQELEIIPIKFNKVNGSFYCSGNKLTSLEFCPEEINGSFDVSYNKLTILEFFPKKIKSGITCKNNNLNSLEFCPKKINGYFDCSNNNLTSLKYSPKEIVGYFYCDNNKLTSLKFLPKKIKGFLDISENKIKKELLYLFDTVLDSEVMNDFGDTEMFLKLVQEQKILFEKEKLINNLEKNDQSQLTKKKDYNRLKKL